MTASQKCLVTGAAGFIGSHLVDRLLDQARRTGIRWYVAQPSEVLRWPPGFLDHPAFASGRYRVYEFRPDAR